MVERQQNVMAVLEETHAEKCALAKKNHEILRRNLLFTLGAEKKKVRQISWRLIIMIEISIYTYIGISIPFLTLDIAEQYMADI